MTVLTAACGTPDPDDRVTISRGVYGQLTCETHEPGPCSVYTVLEVLDRNGENVSTLRHDSIDPFYEVELPNGLYRICEWGCGPFFEIGEESPLVRCDMRAPPGLSDPLFYYCAPRGEW